MFGSCKQGVHKFEPRYDEIDPPWITEAAKKGMTLEIGGNPRKDKIYVCDVCSRCGAVVDARKQVVTGLQAIPGNLFGAGLRNA